MNDLIHQLPTLLAAESTQGAENAEIGWGIFVYVGITLAVVFGLLSMARQGLKERIFKNAWTQRAEQLYLFLEHFALGIIGPHGKKYMPMLATFWLFIFMANFLGLFLPETPTADLSINLGLAITAVLYVQYESIKSNGIGGYFAHFAGPKLGGAMVIVSGMIFIIETISEAMRMLSLSLRLYGNIHGGHVVVQNLNNLGHLHVGDMDVALPVGGLLLPIKLLTVLVQAMVFVLLLSVYIGLVTHHDDADHETHGERALEPAHIH